MITYRSSLFAVCLTLCCAAPVFGQELTRSVVGSAGSYFSTVNVGNIHWTVGEIAVDRTANGMVLERGFHHGLYELIATTVWSVPEVQLTVTAYPNPTADEVNLAGDWSAHDQLRVTDLLGRSLLERSLRPERDRFDLRNRPSGTYLLSILRDGRPVRTLRLIKK